MSHNVNTAIVPYAARRILETESPCDELVGLPLYHIIFPEEDSEDNDESYPLFTGVINGWTLTRYPDKHPDKPNSILCYAWTHLDHGTVFVVNESKYSNVGVFELSVFGKNPSSIQAFVFDNFPNASQYGPVAIQENVVIQSWW